MENGAGHPQRLGDFDILRELGRGGMGIVYEAWQVSLKRRVALKVLSPALVSTPKAVERFQREAEAAAKLHHTNIVPVYSTGETDETHYYAMEFLPGPSLDVIVQRLRRMPDLDKAWKTSVDSEFEDEGDPAATPDLYADTQVDPTPGEFSPEESSGDESETDSSTESASAASNPWITAPGVTGPG